MRLKLVIWSLLLLLLAGIATAAADVRAGKVIHTASADGSITSDIRVCNVGDQVSGNFLVEIQPLASSEKFFSILTTEQKTCDPTHPDNVHKVLSLAQGECDNVVLQTTPLEADTYTIKGVSTNGCCTEIDCAAVDPFKWGTNLGNVVIAETVARVACGDKICSASENSENCASDCGGGFEGDGVCSTWESLPNEPACAGKFNPGNFLKDYKASIIIVAAVIIGGIFLLWVFKRK